MGVGLGREGRGPGRGAKGKFHLLRKGAVGSLDPGLGMEIPVPTASCPSNGNQTLEIPVRHQLGEFPENMLHVSCWYIHLNGISLAFSVNEIKYWKKSFV